MILKDSPYFCLECRKQLSEVTDLLFVEENSSRGFCSEDCIEDFYSPYIKFYEGKVSELRNHYNLSIEVIENSREDNLLVEEISRKPDEVWKQITDLKEEIFYYLMKKDNYYVVVICTQFNNEPSFIFSISKTQSQKLLNEFRIGEKFIEEKEQLTENENIELEMQFLESLDSKKSHLLGELLQRQNENDIPFEEFNFFEKSYTETLTDPDEIYEVKDRDGDLVFNYLKSFVDEKFGNYFYLIVALKKEAENEIVNVYPIISFPTNDINIFNDFRKGTRVLSIIKN